mgnify:CR=1 FL=1
MATSEYRLARFRQSAGMLAGLPLGGPRAGAGRHLAKVFDAAGCRGGRTGKGRSVRERRARGGRRGERRGRAYEDTELCQRGLRGTRVSGRCYLCLPFRYAQLNSQRHLMPNGVLLQQSARERVAALR